jgi:hypothetical protein
MTTATRTRTLEQIEKAYDIDDVAEVREFLTERPRVAELLAEAITVIPRYFGEGTTATLRVRDHLEPGEILYIAAYIRTALSSKDRLDTLHRLKDEWWLKASEGLREEVLLSLDPVRA